MRKFFLFFSILLLLSTTSCSLSAEADPRAYYRPAVGWTVDKEQSRVIELDEQNELKMDVQDGNIHLTPWEGEGIKIKETKRLRAPEARKSLDRDISQFLTSYQSDTYRVNISSKPPEKLKPFSRLTTDYEVSVPKKIKMLTIKGANGSISISGFEGMSVVDLTLETGTVTAVESKAYKFVLAVKRGDIAVEKLEGKGSFNITYGNMDINDMNGEVDLKTTSGKSELRNVDGRVDGNISTGSLDITDSYLRPDSALYATNGDISADLSAIDKEGGYSIMTAAGSIKLKIPKAQGFDLKAKSENGTIKSDFKPDGVQEPGPDNHELSGRIGAGGPVINIYTDRGNVTLTGK